MAKAFRGMARPSLSPGSHLGWGRGQLRPLFRTRRKVELCLFDPKGQRRWSALPWPSAPTRCSIATCPTPARALWLPRHWPMRPRHGHRSNPNKLLIDPYAKALSARCGGPDAHLVTASATAGVTCPSTAGTTPGHAKCRVVDPAHLGARNAAPDSWHETVIYEMHVKG